MYDYHVHSIYSDGSRFHEMCDAASEAGLDGIGFADHCSLTDRDYHRRMRARFNRNFDLTYERRREAIERLREDRSLTIYDAVEIDYEPGIHERIRAFLDEASFDYAFGSVHYVDDRSVFWTGFDDEADRRTFVDRYYDRIVSLIESELFEVVAHVDVIESRPALAGSTTPEHARRVADALVDSRTIPEINAGRADKDDKPADFHPTDPLTRELREREIAFTIGTDSHEPDEFAPRVAALEARIDALGVDPVSPM